MSYIIKNTEVLEETLSTDVEYTFNNGETILVRVVHFMPESMDSVIQNIEQREISEQTRLDAEINNKIIETQLKNLITDSVVETE